MTQVSVDQLNAQTVVDQAIAYLTGQPLTGQPSAPDAAQLVESLVTLEKQAKQEKPVYTYDQLVGSWRLGFITGTKRSQQRAGVVLGAGRFIPKLFDVRIVYSQDPDQPEGDRGRVENTVSFGLLKFTVTGPTRLWPRNILAFDFTRLRWAIAGITLYNGFIRKGQAREEKFPTLTVKDQAFFTYFQVSDRHVAARGRGGGLALWTRVDE